MPIVPIYCSDAFAEGGGTATRNFRLTAGALIATAGVEANRQTLYRTAGTLRSFYTKILTNDHTGASTMRVRKNGANGNQLLSIPASTTGEFEDLVNTDVVAAGDLMNIQLIIGAGGTTFTLRNNRATYEASSGETVTPIGTGGDTISGVNTSTPVVGSTLSATEANNQVRMPFAATWRNYGVYVAVNTRDGNITSRPRVNGANVNQVVTIITLTTGWFEDVVNTDALVAGDLISLLHVTSGTAGSAVINSTKSEIVTNTSSFLVAGSFGQTINQGVTTYYQIGGSQVTTATESSAQVKSGANYTASNLGILVSANTVTLNSTFKLRKNAADGNQSVTITASTTGHFIDNTNTDVIVSTDQICTQLITGAAGTSLTTRTFEMQGDATPTGGSTLLLMGVG